MTVTYRIPTDIIIRTLTHITATIHHTIPTIPITEIMDMEILIGMVTGMIGITLVATTRIVTSIMARDAHKVIEAPVFDAHHPTDRARKRTANQIKLPQGRVVRNVGNQEDIKGGTSSKMRRLDYTISKRVDWKTICALFLILFIITFVPTNSSLAQVEEIAIGNTFGVGARAMGMGGAFLGIADDLTALYWNPAGLAQIRKFELHGSLSHHDINAETQFAGTRPINASRSKTRPNSAGIVYPLDARRGGFAIGLGYNRPQNFDSRIVVQGIDSSDDTIFGGLDVNETNSDRGGIGIWSFGAGVYISENIILGASMDFWHGTYVNELESISTDVNNIDAELTSFAFHDTIDREYFGVGGRIGLLAYVTEDVTLGFTAVAPMDIEVDEVWREETDVIFDDGESERDSDQGAILFDIERPFELGAGIGVKLLQKCLTLASDIQFTDWTQTQYSTSPTEDVTRDNFEQFYDKTIQIRVGAEYQIKKIDAYTRVGYLYDPIPFNAKEIDNNRNFLTIGIGKVFDEVVKFDIAYIRGSWKQSAESLSTAQTSNRLFVSAAYRY